MKKLLATRYLYSFCPFFVNSFPIWFVESIFITLLWFWLLMSFMVYWPLLVSS